MEVSGKLEAPAGLTLGKESPVPMNGRLGSPKASQVVTYLLHGAESFLRS